MINQEEVCIWFNDLEACSRIELMCALLDSCLPLELRFLGTYLEYLAGKHYTHLQKYEKEANKTSSWFSSENFSDTMFRKKICLFLALLYSHNHTMAIKLFKVLDNWNIPSLKIDSDEGDNVPVKDLLNHGKSQNEEISHQENIEAESDLSQRQKIFCNEMKLLFSMACLHPAFDYSQHSRLRKKKRNIENSCKCDSRNVTDIHDDLILTHTDGYDEIFDNNFKKSEEENSEITFYEDENVDVDEKILKTSVEMQFQHDFVVTPLPSPGNFSAVVNLPQNQFNMTAYGSNFPSRVMMPSAIPPLDNAIPVDILPIPQPCLVNSGQIFTANVSIQKPVINNNNSITTFVHNMITPPSPLLGAPFPVTVQNDTKNDIANINDIYLNSGKKFALNMTNNKVNTGNHQTIYSLQQFSHPNLPSGNPLIGIPTCQEFTTLLSTTSSITEMKQDIPVVRTLVSTTMTMATSQPRRCLSESDAYEKVNTVIREPLVPVIKSEPIEIHSLPENRLKHVTQITLPINTHAIPPGNSNHLNMLKNNNNNTITTGQCNSYVNDTNSVEPINKDFSSSLHQQELKQQPPNLQPNIHPPISLNDLVEKVEPSSLTSKTIDNRYLNGTFINSRYLDLKGRKVTRVEGSRKPDAYNSELSVNIPYCKSLPIPMQSIRKNQVSCRLPQDHLVDSSYGSPTHSPRPSPFESPVHSPVLQKRMINDISETYASASNWLKSLRLHKYTPNLENYSFEEMTKLDVDTIMSLGLKQGASDKLKRHIDALASCGFKAFGSADNINNTELHRIHASLSPNSPRVQLPRSYDTNPTNNSHDGNPVTLSSLYDYNTVSSPKIYEGNTVQSSSFYNDPMTSAIPIPINASEFCSPSPSNVRESINTKEELKQVSSSMETSNLQSFLADTVENIGEQQSNDVTMEGMTIENVRMRKDHMMEDYSDDEVFAPRRRIMNVTCYNCGQSGHYGDECTEQTMESQTYIRYAYQLNYSRSTENTQTQETTSTINTAVSTITSASVDVISNNR